MKISMIVLNPFTHDARVMREAFTLVEHGHQVTVNALWERGLSFEEQVRGIHVRRIRLRTREGVHVPLAAWVELVPKFTAAVRLQQPDVCHAHDLNGLIPGYFASRLTGARLVYDAHEFEIGRTAERSSSTVPRRWAWQKIEGALIRRSQASLTVSASIAKELSRMYGVQPPKIVMNCPELIDLPPAGRLRSELGIPDGQPIVLFQGVLSEGRGLENALRAVAQITPAWLVMVGDGPLRGSLELLAQELHMSGRLRFTGKVPLQSLLQYTRDASIGLCLTENTCLNHYYSLPNKLFEYLMVGLPVLASDFPDMRAVVEESGAGQVADPADIAGIVQALQVCFADRDVLARMSRQARRAAETRYNWNIEAQTLLEIYENLRN